MPPVPNRAPNRKIPTNTATVPITNQAAVVMWVVYALVLFLAALAPLVAGPDEPSDKHANWPRC